MKQHFSKKKLTREQIKSNKYLKFLTNYLDTANLWHFNRKSVAGGVAVGLFCAWVPIPFQMILATIFSVICSTNIPVSIALVWITNPLTMAAFYYFAYWVGVKILNMPLQDIEFQLSFDWLLNILGQIWQPFLFGCFFIGTLSAIIGYFLVTWAWRYRTARRWSKRVKRV